jgi:hypothetical protein
VDAIQETVSQRLIIDGERLPEVEQYRNIIDDIALVVLQGDEPAKSASSDNDNSTDDECTLFGDLTLVSRLCFHIIVHYTMEFS